MLAILGGTFDPPHVGHLIIAEAALALPGCERVTLMPAGDPYRKAPIDPNLDAPSGAIHRLAMTKLAIAGNDAFVVDQRELQRPGPTYTADSLEALATDGMTQPYFIVGADALADMRHWSRPERIRALARIVVAPRPGVDLDGCPYPLLDMPALGVSSTDIRRRVRDGLSLRYLVPDAVAWYIRDHGLYR